jgi:prolyl oligopeptidase
MAPRCRTSWCAKALAFDGKAPTLLYGYGGFEMSMTARYSGGIGKAWLEPGRRVRGGQHPRRRRVRPALAPGRHQGQQAEGHDDFAAVADDLIARKITAPQHLGIRAAATAACWWATVMLQRPELFGAVVSQVPLLDMRRYTTCWPARRGWPSTATRTPRLGLDLEVQPLPERAPRMKLPRVLFTTSTATTACTPATPARWPRARLR